MPEKNTKLKKNIVKSEKKDGNLNWKLFHDNWEKALHLLYTFD